MKNKFLVMSFLILCTRETFGQTAKERQELDAEIRTILQARDEMFKSLLEDDSFSQFDKRFNDLIKKFDQDSIQLMPGVGESGVVGEYDWRENDNQLILALKVKQIKNKPLDIKIEKGFVLIKGDVEEILQASGKSGGKKTSRIHFERSFSIPQGVDQTSPEFENKEGELLIKFKKLKGAQINSVKSKSPKGGPDRDLREPVGRDSDDEVI